MAADLKQMVEDLQRDLEAKGDEKNYFINQIADHQRMLKEQEDAFIKLSEKYKQLETSLQQGNYRSHRKDDARNGWRGQ